MKQIDYNNYDGVIEDANKAPIDDALYKEEIFYYIGEDFEEYHNPNRGEIVFVKTFLYPNGNIGENHLFVIMGNDEYIDFEYYSMLISSQVYKEKYKYNYRVNKDKINNLNKDSIVKTDVIYKLKGENIVKYIGTISEEMLEKFEKMNKECKNEKC